MLSLSSLLNPISATEPPKINISPSSLSYDSHTPTNESRRSGGQLSPARPKMSKDGAVFFKGKIMGSIMYPPFENLDQDSLRAVRKYKIFPLGEIAKYPRHIPYNSEKKNFFERTGRLSFEVFQYTFQLPGEEKEYTVMWDYNIGLVRITPFFKCCGYSKTIPAKMLGMNQGLKEITHSITGGALAAQGYWMPYNCAFAVCATFCANIAGALIPIFGPAFPSECVPANSPLCGRMVIDQSIIIRSTEDALAFRIGASSCPTSNPSSSNSHALTPSPSLISSQTANSMSSRSTLTNYSLMHEHARKRLKPKCRRAPCGESVDTDSEASTSYYHLDRTQFSNPSTPITPYTLSPASSASGYTSSGWTVANSHPQARFAQHNQSALTANANIAGRNHEMQRQSPDWRPAGSRYPPTPTYVATPNPSPVASPWLSAIPRTNEEQRLVIGALNQNTPSPTGRQEFVGLGIRRFDTEEDIYDADNDASSGGSPERVKLNRRGSSGTKNRDIAKEHFTGDSENGSTLIRPEAADDEKSAALMLMSLCVGDGKGDTHGVKRKRAASF